MSKIYYLKYFDDVLGTVDRATFEFIANDEYEKPFPLSFFGGDRTPSRERMKMFLSDLVASEDNQGIDLIMSDFRYPIYNLWVLLDATCGIGMDSNYWIVPKEKLHWKYKTHHVRSNPNLWMAVVDSDGVIHQPKLVDASEINDVPEEWLHVD